MQARTAVLGDSAARLRLELASATVPASMSRQFLRLCLRRCLRWCLHLQRYWCRYWCRHWCRHWCSRRRRRLCMHLHRRLFQSASIEHGQDTLPNSNLWSAMASSFTGSAARAHTAALARRRGRQCQLALCLAADEATSAPPLEPSKSLRGGPHAGLGDRVSRHRPVARQDAAAPPRAGGWTPATILPTAAVKALG